MIEDGWMRVQDFVDRYKGRSNTIVKWAHDGLLERGVIYANPTGGLGYVHEELMLEWMKENDKL